MMSDSIVSPFFALSFPSLSQSSSISLSSMEAHIEGPEDTVYSNGTFVLKIQVPQRYPFQPLSVTFAASIYHPNIDDGGRICLDVLNSPPKGAWQPSMNISSILTSIRLLMSEPNPDDGLMDEAQPMEADKAKDCLVHETERTRKNLGIGSRCLSLKPEVPNELDDDDKENFVPAIQLSVSQKSKHVVLSSISALA